MSFTVTNLTIDPPTAGDLCDRCHVAKAVVSAGIVPGGCKNPIRFVFCGHHFDALQRTDKPFKIFNDTRLS